MDGEARVAKVARVDGVAVLKEAMEVELKGVVDMAMDLQQLVDQADMEVDTKRLLDMEVDTKRPVVTEVDTRRLEDTEVDNKREVTEVVHRVVMAAPASAITGVVREAHGVDSKEVAMEVHLRQAVKAAGVREAAGVDPKQGVGTEVAKAEEGSREVMTAETTADKRLAAPPGSPGNPLAGALEVMPPSGATTNQLGKEIHFDSAQSDSFQKWCFIIVIQSK